MRRGAAQAAGAAGGVPAAAGGQEGAPALVPARRRRGRAVAVVVAVLVALVAVAAGLCAWTLWFRFDDAADFRGTWRSAAGAQVVIDEHQMQLPEGVAYGYELDAGAKTVMFSFGQMEGGGWYHFSQDRDVLVIDENGAPNVLVVLGLAPDPALVDPTADGLTVLYRLSREQMATMDLTVGGGSGSGSGTTLSPAVTLPASPDATDAPSADADGEPDEQGPEDGYGEDGGDGGDDGDQYVEDDEGGWDEEGLPAEGDAEEDWVAEDEWDEE